MYVWIQRAGWPAGVVAGQPVRPGGMRQGGLARARHVVPERSGFPIKPQSESWGLRGRTRGPFSWTSRHRSACHARAVARLQIQVQSTNLKTAFSLLGRKAFGAPAEKAIFGKPTCNHGANMTNAQTFQVAANRTKPCRSSQLYVRSYTDQLANISPPSLHV